MEMGQRINPHTLRVNNLDIITKVHAFNSELFDLKVTLENLFGEAKYKRIVSKVKK